ncbi:hypothetical protein PRIPAC_95382, partial [Pristionchus pacificus]|uniref:Ethe-1 n=1 Tax=Pristionchus pacificus TaxID=54126 RepID=A0A2A6B355_PRIPA
VAQLFEATSCTYTYIIGCTATRKAVIIDVLETVERDAKIFPSMLSCLSDESGAKADRFLRHGEKLTVGRLEMECRHTPGHTHGCSSYILNSEGIIFTGDALLFRGCGRTDFQQGKKDRVNRQSRSQAILVDCHMSSSVGEEKKQCIIHDNVRLTLEKENFIELMSNLNLAYPKQIDRALPANLKNGEQ